MNICPLCPYGCKLGIEVKPGFFVRINYSGPLCARGNAIPYLLSSPKRLYSPRRGEGNISWEEAFFEVVREIKNFPPEKIALGFDSSLTYEEREEVLGFAEGLGVDLFYFNLENFTSYLISGIKLASLSTVAESEAILVVGDVLSRFPLFVRPLLEAKYDKKAKILVVDIYPNRLMDFADDFLVFFPGKEIDLFLSDERIFSPFVEAKRGVLLLDAPPGRLFDPITLHLASQLFLLNTKGEKYFLPLTERMGGFGNKPAGEVLERVLKGEISLLIFFGEFPLNDFLHGRHLIRITPFRETPGPEVERIELPSPHIVEKEGNILTFWGKVKKEGLPSVSGTKGVKEIIQRLAKSLGLSYKRGKVVQHQRVEVREAKEMLDTSLRLSLPKEENDRLYFLNQESAIDYGGFFHNGREIRLSPKDAEKRGLRNGETVFVESKGDLSKKALLRVAVDGKVPAGLAFVSLAYSEIRNLFSVSFDKRLDEVIMSPVAVKIWKEG